MRRAGRCARGPRPTRPPPPVARCDAPAAPHPGGCTLELRSRSSTSFFPSLLFEWVAARGQKLRERQVDRALHRGLVVGDEALQQRLHLDPHPGVELHPLPLVPTRRHRQWAVALPHSHLHSSIRLAILLAARLATADRRAAGDAPRRCAKLGTMVLSRRWAAFLVGVG